MVEQQARVLAVNGELLELEAETTSTCSSCGVSSGCGTSVLARWLGRKFTHFQALNTVDARVGDQVVVGLPESALLGGSVTIYLLPLLAMITAALLADFAISPDNAERDALIALSALAGLLMSLAACRAYLARSHVRRRLTPVVLRKIIQHGKLAP